MRGSDVKVPGPVPFPADLVWPENSIYLKQREIIPGVVDNEMIRCQSAWTRSAFLLISLAGWMNQRQLNASEYLREENRVLREQLGGKRLRLNDDQRRRFFGTLEN